MKRKRPRIATRPSLEHKFFYTLKGDVKKL